MNYLNNNMTSKERVIAAINHGYTDHLPLSFEGIGFGYPIFLRKKIPDTEKRIQFYLDKGIDVGIKINQNYDQISKRDLDVREWVDESEEKLLVKEYITPEGSLFQKIRKDTVSFNKIKIFDDYNVPAARSKQYLVEKKEDLKKLKYILAPINEDECKIETENLDYYKKICEEKQILLSAHILGIGDVLTWLSGVENLLDMALGEPEFLADYIEIVERWNISFVKLCLKWGVNLFVRRGWYESLSFWSPALYRKFFYEPLKKEIDLIHGEGQYVVYVQDSELPGMTDIFNELGFDMFTGFDKYVAGMEMLELKEKIGNKICLLGGVNNFHVIENGTKSDIRNSVIETVESLKDGGGFILGPSDHIDFANANPVKSEENFYEMIKVWDEIKKE